MVVSESEVSHRPDRDRIVAVRRRHDLWPLFDGTDTKDRYLRLIDDRRPEKPAEYSGICDSERSALDLVRIEAFGASPLRKVVCLCRELGQRERIGVFDHRYDQAPIQGNGHPEIDIGLINDLVARHLSVNYPKTLYRVCYALKNKGHKGELRPEPLLEIILVLCTKAGDVRHVDLVNARDVGRRLF